MQLLLTSYGKGRNSQMSHKAKPLIKYAKLMLNIVDFPFDDTCWLAKLIEYVIMGGLLMPIIDM